MRFKGEDTILLNKKPTVLKLGGSVITVKEKPYTPNKRIITRLAEEIKRSNVSSIVVVHGGGSFGHPLAKEYELVDGYKNVSQLIGLSRTHQAMESLNRLIVYAFVQKNMPAIAVQPSAFIMARRGKISLFDGTLISKMLNLNLIPVLYGDVVLDEEQGFSILSGDQLVAALATSFNSSRIVICVDVNGLYTDDPKLNPKARLIEQASLHELKIFQKKIGRSMAIDVTGGMFGKISELIPALETGIEVDLINGKKANRLYKALTNQIVKGTKIKS